MKNQYAYIIDTMSKTFLAGRDITNGWMKWCSKQSRDLSC